MATWLEEALRDRVVLVTGGAGTVGVALIERLLQFRPRNIRVYSRDENKQYFLRDRWAAHPGLRFFVGDVRDKDRLNRAMDDVDYVFHLAALKHVESCEYNPFEAIQTNIVGTQNVIDVSMAKNVRQVVFTSTDKAVNPANAMGASKLMAEKLIVATNYYKGRRATRFVAVRFGNVLASSGSVIPTFLRRISLGLPIEVTHREMTRFVITMDDSVDLLLATLDVCRGGEILVRRMPVLRIMDLAEVLLEITGLPADDAHLRVVTPRAGEKIFEELVTEEEAARTVEVGDYLVVKPPIAEAPALPDERPAIARQPYTSAGEAALDKAGIRDLLRTTNPELFAEGR